MYTDLKLIKVRMPVKRRLMYGNFLQFDLALKPSIFQKLWSQSGDHLKCLSLIHQDNMSLLLITPCIPLLYSKTGVYRGIHNFLIIAPKHSLWVFVRTASLRRF